MYSGELKKKEGRDQKMKRGRIGMVKYTFNNLRKAIGNRKII